MSSRFYRQRVIYPKDTGLDATALAASQEYDSDVIDLKGVSQFTGLFKHENNSVTELTVRFIPVDEDGTTEYVDHRASYSGGVSTLNAHTWVLAVSGNINFPVNFPVNYPKCIISVEPSAGTPSGTDTITMKLLLSSNE